MACDRVARWNRSSLLSNYSLLALLVGYLQLFKLLPYFMIAALDCLLYFSAIFLQCFKHLFHEHNAVFR